MDIQNRILEKQHEMEVLRQQMQALNQQHLEDLYPGRCFQYCIDHGIGTQDELAILSGTEIRHNAERAHFDTVARKTYWPCGDEECQGWNGMSEECACGAKRFYWMYEEILSLNASTIEQSPAASAVE